MSIKVTHIPVSAYSSLYQHVESITNYEFLDGQVVRFYPEGRIELLFQFESSFLHRSSSDTSWILRPDGFVGGLHDRSYHVKPLNRNTRCLGVKFKPDTARHYIPLALHLLTNRVMSISDLWDEGSSSILMRNVKNASDTDAILTSIERFLSAQYHALTPNEIEHSCLEILKQPGGQTIRKLAGQSDFSISHFRKKFNEQIGLAPKIYSKIIRVNLAMEHLQRGSYSSLTSLALSLGYYDQAHFIREFKSVTDLTPSQFLHTF
jgi:AraC-like DNA-binding protein